MQHEHLVGSAGGDDQTLVYAAPAEDHTLKIMVHGGEQETTQYEHLVGSAGGDDQTLVYAAAPAEDQNLKYLGGDGDRTLTANSQAEGVHEGGPSLRPAKERVTKKRIVLEKEDVGCAKEAVAETVRGEEDGGGGPATSSNDAELQPVRKRRNVRANVPLADADALTIGHLSPPAPIVIDSDDGEEECTQSNAEREACRVQGSLAAGGRGQKEEEIQAAKRPRLDVAKGREGDSISHPSDGGLPCSWECSACTFINASTRSVACGMCAVEREVSTKWAAAAAQTSQREKADDEGKKGFSVISTWSCQMCTLKNRGGIDALCAVCESPREDHDNSSSLCYSSKSSSIQSLVAQQAPVSAAAQKLSEKVAREVHQKKEMEERTLLVRAEQKRKKEHEKKVKQQLEEDRMIRKLKPIVRRAKNLSVDELRAHVEAIETFVAENGRPSDILADLLETLKVQTIPVTNAAGHFAMDMERSVVLVDASRAMGADLEIAKKEIWHITKEKTMQMGGKTNMGLVMMGSTETKHGLGLDGYLNVFTVRNIKERNMEQTAAITEACNNLTVQEEECSYASGLMVALDMLVKTESSRGHEHNEKVYLVSNGKSDFTPEDNKLMDKMCDHLKRKEILLTVLGINFSSDDEHTWSTGEAMLRDLVKRSGGTLEVVRNFGNQSDTRLLRFFTGPLSSLQGLVTVSHTARNPQKGNVHANGGSSSSSSRAINSADLAALAAERKRRDQARGADTERAAAAAGQKYPDDLTLMRGEAEARAANVVKRWHLCDGSQRPLAFLEPAGLTHLAIIKNTLAFREPSVKLVKAQYICNPQLMWGFEQLRHKHPSHHVVYLFHGTSENNIESIIANGFLVKHAQSGGGLIWFSRQSTYSYAFTVNMGKGVSLSGQPAKDMNPANFVPSGRMFVCKLLVARTRGPTSNVGDAGQDVITMTKERACLPLYLIDTSAGDNQMGLNGLNGVYAPSPFIAPGMLGTSQGLVTSIRQVMGSYAAFSGKGERLGGHG